MFIATVYLYYSGEILVRTVLKILTYLKAFVFSSCVGITWKQTNDDVKMRQFFLFPKHTLLLHKQQQSVSDFKVSKEFS